MKKIVLVIIFINLIFSITLGKDITIEATSKNANVNFKKETFSARGEIRLSYENIKIQADHIRKDPVNAEIIASGNVIFKQDNYTVDADKVVINLFDKTATVDNGNSFSDKFFFGGKKLEAKFPDEANVEDSYFTTDYLTSDPVYRFEAAKMKIKPGDKIVAYNVRLYAGKICILWTPYYATSLKQDNGRNSLFPRFGSSDRYGSFVKWGLDYDIHPKYAKGYVDAMFSGKKGWLLTLSNDYKFSDSNKGNFCIKDWNIPRPGVDEQWNFMMHHSIDTPEGTDLSKKFFKDSHWDLNYQNQSTNDLYDDEGNRLDPNVLENRTVMWKVGAKGVQKMGKDMQLDVDVEQSQEDLVKKLVEINRENSLVEESLPDRKDIYLKTKLGFSIDNSFYRFFVTYDDESHLNEDMVNLPFKKKQNWETGLNLKPYKIDFNYKHIDQDVYTSNPIDPMKNIVKSPYIREDNYNVKLGNYNLNNSSFYWGTALAHTDKRSLTYDYSYDPYDLDHPQKTEIEENSNSLTTTVGNNDIPLFLLGTGDFVDNTTFTEFNPTQSEMDITSNKQNAATHDIALKIHTPIYDNSKDKLRGFDLMVENEVPLAYRVTNGEVPSLAQNNNNTFDNTYATTRAYGDGLKINFGNLELNNEIGFKENMPFKQDYINGKEKNFTSTAKIGDQSLKFQMNKQHQFDELHFLTTRNDHYLFEIGLAANSSFLYEYTTDARYSPNEAFRRFIYEQTNVHRYNFMKEYSEYGWGTGFRNSKTDTYDQNNPNTKTTDRYSDTCTLLLKENGEDKKYLKDVSATYIYGEDKLKNKKSPSTLDLSMGFVDKSDSIEDKNKKKIKPKIKSVNYDKNSQLKLFKDEEIATQNILDEADETANPFDLERLGDMSNDPLDSDNTASLYKEYHLRVAFTKDEEYAKDHPGFNEFEKSLTALTIEFEMKLKRYFYYKPTLTLSRTTGGETPIDNQLGQVIKVQLFGNYCPYWLTLDTKYDYNRKDQLGNKIGWTDYGIGISHEVRAIRWDVEWEHKWDETQNQFDTMWTLKLYILAFPDKGISYTQRKGQRSFGMGI